MLNHLSSSRNSGNFGGGANIWRNVPADYLPVRPAEELDNLNFGAPDQLPQFTYPAEGQTFSAQTEQFFSLQVSAADPEGQEIEYQGACCVSSMAIDQTTGLFTWTPLASQMGTHEIRVTVSDRPGEVTRQVTRTFIMVVTAPAEEPDPQPDPAPAPAPQTLGVRLQGKQATLQDIQEQLNEIAQSLEEIQSKVDALTQNPVPACTTFYTVQSGDTLSHVALRYYGDSGTWPKIYEANKEIIGENPDLIKPGQRLCVPGTVQIRAPGKTNPVIVEVEKTAVGTAQDGYMAVFRLTAANVEDLDLGPLTETYNSGSSAALTLEASEKVGDFLQPFWSIASGEPKNAGEIGADFALSLLVVGDIRDSIKHGYLFLTKDPNANGWVLTFSAIGIATTLTGAGDSIPAALKTLANAIPLIKGSSRLVGDAVEQAFLHNLTSMNLERLGKLPEISRLAVKLTGRNAYPAYERVLRSRVDVENLARYVDEGGDSALLYTEKMAGKFPTTKFDWEREPEQFTHAWTDHQNHWQALNIADEAQFQQTLDEVIQNGWKVMYRQPVPSGGYEDRFGFYDEARNIFVASKDDGRLWTAFRPSADWNQPGAGLNYVMNQKWLMEIK